VVFVLFSATFSRKETQIKLLLILLVLKSKEYQNRTAMITKMSVPLKWMCAVISVTERDTTVE
jgi:hypothetical protein